jgi:hypothetical protein
VREHRQRTGVHQFTREGDDEGFAAEGVDVRRDGAQPLDELDRVFHLPHYNSLRILRTKYL